MAGEDRTIPERVTATETTQDFILKRLDGMDDKLDTLLAAYNRQQGFVIVGRLLWGSVCAGLALAGDWLITNWPKHP